MDYRIGTDIIEVERIKNAMENAEFSTRVFTPEEIEYCESGSDKIKYQRYAARFAAKEAVFKAISSVLDSKFDIEWKDIEILKDEQDRPFVNLYGVLKERIMTTYNIDISISHVSEIAVASCVVQFE